MRNSFKWTAIGVAIVFAVVTLIPSSALAAATARVYPVSIDGFAAPDAGSLAVRYRVTNNGTKSVSPSCELRAYDGQGTELGLATINAGTIAPGVTLPLLGRIKIPTQSASLIVKIGSTCIAITDDRGTLSKSKIKVILKGNCLGGVAYGAYDPDQQVWYWGSCAQAVGVSSNTHLQCTENALDARGKIIATHTFKGITNGDGGIAGYGSKQDPTANTVKAIALAIKNVTWSCTRF